MARLVMFGATGYAGSRLLEEAVSRSHRVTAVSRHTNPGSRRGDCVRWVSGSLYDRDLVEQLSAEADVLISAINSGPDENGHTLLDAVPIMIDVAEHSAVRIAVVGGAGSLLLNKGGDPVITRLESIAPPDKLRDINLHVQLLDALYRTPSDVDWFYLSPPTGFGAHVPGERLGHYRLGDDVLLTDGAGNSAISGDDYAMAFVDEIERPRHRRQRFTVAY